MIYINAFFFFFINIHKLLNFSFKRLDILKYYSVFTLTQNFCFTENEVKTRYK